MRGMSDVARPLNDNVWHVTFGYSSEWITYSTCELLSAVYSSATAHEITN